MHIHGIEPQTFVAEHYGSIQAAIGAAIEFVLQQKGE